VNTETSANPTEPHDSGPVIASVNARTGVAAAMLLLIVVTIWVPFGTGGNPQGDGWILKDRVANGERFFASNPTRVLIYMPWSLAHFFTPDSFVGVNLLLIAILWGKGMLLFSIVRWLPGCHDGFAALTAALSIVYPAGTRLITLDESVDRHWAVFFLLLSVLLLLEFWRTRRPGYLLGMGSAQFISLWTNEAILLLALATPLMLLWVAHGRSREFWRASALWLVVPALNAIHNGVHHVMVVLNPGGTAGYSRGVKVLAIEDGWRPMVESILIAYRRHLADGWWRCFRQLDGEWSLIALAAITVVLVTIVGVLLWPKNGSLDHRLLRFLIIAGMLVIGLGFAPFVPTSLRFTDGRSFIISSLGAVLVVSALAGFMCNGIRWKHKVFQGVIGILIGAGMIGMLAQHALYVRGSLAQDAILESIIEQAPGVLPGTFFAVGFREKPKELRRAAGFHRRGSVLHHALSFLYDDPSLQAGLLVSKAGAVRGDDYRLTPEGISGHMSPGRPFPTIPYERALVFRVRRDLKVKLLRWLPRQYRDPAARTYLPLWIINTDVPPPRRWGIVSHEKLR